MRYPPRRHYTIALPSRRVLQLGLRPLVMGILNVTPDSFADASPRLDPEAAVASAFQLEAEGADIIDIGGESTRPGAAPVSAEQELARVLPVVRALAGRMAIPLSIDTYKAEVARAALAEGVSIVNDVSGLLFDEALAGVVAHAGAALILMHTRGRPQAMYAEADYRDVAGEVVDELAGAMKRAQTGGMAVAQLILDPGIGFAKRPPHSYGVLAAVPDIAAALDRPVLVGPSRKSFMREALGDLPPAERDWGTAAAVTAAVLGGAHIVRVHAVAQMAQAVRVAEEIRRHGDGSSFTA